MPITHAEIDVIAAIFGNIGDGGDIELGDGTSSGGVATLDHSLLYNRDLANQHTIESITGLEDALTAAEGEDLATLDIEDVWNNAT